MKKLLILFLLTIAGINLVSSALILSSSVQDTIYPGESGYITISLKNDFDYSVEQVSLSLDFSKTKFTAVGSSQRSIDEILDSKKQDIRFTIKSANDLSPGDYLIPYTLTYQYENTTPTITGFIGVTINSKINLDYSVSADKPVIGQKSKINFKIINKGFGDIKFATLTIQPSGYKLLSTDKIYIGAIASDDFQTANYDVFFDKGTSHVMATITYTDFENNEKTEYIDLPLKVYTLKDAQNLGIISNSSLPWYVFTIPLIIIFYIVIRKARKKKKQQKENEEL